MQEALKELKEGISYLEWYLNHFSVIPVTMYGNHVSVDIFTQDV